MAMHATMLMSAGVPIVLVFDSHGASPTGLPRWAHQYQMALRQPGVAAASRIHSCYIPAKMFRKPTHDVQSARKRESEVQTGLQTMRHDEEVEETSAPNLKL